MHIPRTCALQCRIKDMLVLSVAVVLMLCVCSKAQAKMSYPYIGVASMQLFDTGNEYWDSQFRLLAKHSYGMKYSAFGKIADKMQNPNVKPTALKDEETGKALTYVHKQAVERFHAKFDSSYDQYLRVISNANRCRAIIFDNIERTYVQKFIQGELGKMQLTVRVYYLDSNTLGMKYVPITKDSFSNLPRLKQKLHEAISSALQEAMVNVGAGSSPQISSASMQAETGNGSGDSSEKQDAGDSGEKQSSSNAGFWE